MKNTVESVGVLKAVKMQNTKLSSVNTFYKEMDLQKEEVKDLSAEGCRVSERINDRYAGQSLSIQKKRDPEMEAKEKMWGKCE